MIEPISPSPPRTWAEISLSALKHNLTIASQRSGNAIMAILKAGAYGHGIEQIALSLDTEKLPFFGVASVIEARKLQLVNIRTPLYLLGPTFPEEREEIVQHQWIPSLSTYEEIEHFQQLAARLKKTLKVHLTLDTGMGRGGFLPKQFHDAMNTIIATPNLLLEGIGSHLPSADEDRDFTLHQIDLFQKTVQPHPLPYIHLLNSAGILGYTTTATSLARPGLMLYGLSPLPQYQSVLQPVMTLKSRISLIRTLPKGHGISYGRSTILQNETKVATIGAGYGDGYPRALSNRGASVMIRGKRCPLLGRVTMDQIMVDISNLPHSAVGDEVELFGPNILISELSEKTDLIPWEILTGITPRVTRLHL